MPLRKPNNGKRWASGVTGVIAPNQDILVSGLPFTPAYVEIETVTGPRYYRRAVRKFSGSTSDGRYVLNGTEYAGDSNGVYFGQSNLFYSLSASGFRITSSAGGSSVAWNWTAYE